MNRAKWKAGGPKGVGVKVRQRNSPAVPITLLAAAFLICAAWTDASAQTISRCDVNIRGGGALPVSDLPKTFTDVDWGFGAGLSCGQRLRIAGTLELMNVGYPRIWYFFGEVRWLRHLGSDLLSPWLSFGGGPGLFFNRGSGPLPPVGTPGHGARIPSEGFALGGSVRLGYPTVGRWSLFLDTAIRVAFVPTECFFECNPSDGGPNTLWTLPITAGLQVEF